MRFLELARPGIPIVHPTMNIIDFINAESKKWDIQMLGKFVHPYPMIRSLAIS